MKKIIPLVLIMLLSLSIVINISTVNAHYSTPSLFYVGRDLTTQGNWIDQGYGDCLPKCGGYALPYTNVTGKEVAIGKVCLSSECDKDCDSPCGSSCDTCCPPPPPACSCNESWWFEPWSIRGLKYYPYEDYRGGKSILEYEIIGPKGAPRPLVDANSMYYRPSWYCNDSSITVTLSGIAGNYKVSIYLLDWDAPNGGVYRKAKVNVTSSGDWDTVTLGNTFPENFAAGTYAIFEVNSDGTIKIEVTNLRYPLSSAAIAGVFLDAIPGPVTGVNFVGLDRETKGNWRYTYGNSYYLLPGFNVPSSGVFYKPINKAYDETNILSGNYAVSEGTCQYAADDAMTFGKYPYIGQYAAYVWTERPELTASDPRLLIYPKDKIYYGYPPTPLNGRLFSVWDSGEMGAPLNYFIIKVKIPYYCKNVFSIYAVDFERMGRSETVQIWDESMTTMLDSQYITSDEINNGIYVQWYVQGPRTINVKVIADPGKLNSFINGIFLNCISYYCYDGKTMSFWKNNINVALSGGTPQVSKQKIIKALNTITKLYGLSSRWNFDWLTFTGDDTAKLTQALNILQNYGPDMLSKAKAQILASLLTDTHYGKHFYLVRISWFEGGKTRTITGWITIILDNYNSGNYETAHNLANYLNNL